MQLKLLERRRELIKNRNLGLSLSDTVNILAQKHHVTKRARRERMDEAAFNAWCEQQPPGSVHMFVWVHRNDDEERAKRRAI